MSDRPRLLRRVTYLAFLVAIWAPLIAVLCSPQLGPFAAHVEADPGSYEAERNRLRLATPLWNRAVAFYSNAMYRLGVNSRPGAALVGRDGWIFLGDIFEANIAQALGRRVLDDNEVAAWTATLGEESRWLAQRHIASAFVVAPAKWSIYPDRLPRWTRKTDRVHSFDRILAARGTLPLIDVRDALREARNHADTYSALNSHWTDYGAWVAWSRIAPEIKRLAPDLPAPRVRALKSVSVSDEDNEFADMLGLDAPNEWTKYVLATPLADALIVAPDGWTTPLPGGAQTNLLDLPRTTRSPSADNRLRVLVLRDSSGNSLSPFLQDAYYETYQVDHRLGQPGTGPNLPALVEAFRPDLVLWIMTERYLNGPLGDPAEWRAANAFDCAHDPLAAWTGTGSPTQHSGDGAEESIALRDEIARSAVLRLEVEAETGGELSLADVGQSAVQPARVNVASGKNELFFKVNLVEPWSSLVVRHKGNAKTTAVEVRAGDCD
jgi:SGNH hydrolase-like domain, acetyltransferase AlgX